MPFHAEITASAALIFLSLMGPAAAQPPSDPAPQVLTAMEKLAWMKGEWEGEGWRATREGRETFNVRESVGEELDGLVIVVHGRGWAAGENGEEIEGHKAFGVLSYDAFAQTYRFDAFVKQGYQTRTAPQIEDNGYRWSHPAGPDTQMRYFARLTDGGEWLETGERCVKDACVPAMEMRLKRTGTE
jgi:hypothetical protein